MGNPGSIDLVKATFDDLAAQTPIKIDGTRIGVEYPEIRTPFTACSYALHRGTQQSAAKAAAAPIGPDMEVVDIGAEARVTVSLALAIERRAERAVLEDSAIGRPPARRMQRRNRVGVGYGGRPYWCIRHRLADRVVA
jgi:hypothetical protein